MPESLFADSRARIERAIVHAKSITQEWTSLIDPNQRADTRIEKRSDTRYVAVSILKVAPANDIAILIGEFFYQLRAALDAAMYKSLVLQDGKDPPDGANRVEFPIYDDEKQFDKCLAMKSSLPQQFKDLLRSIQPFAGETTSEWGLKELGRRLEVLHDCARKDRHRRLHVVMASITKLRAAFECSPNVAISAVKPLPIDFLRGESEFLGFEAAFSSEDPTTFIRLRTGVTIELCISEIPGYAGNELLSELEQIMLATQHVVDVFENWHRT